VELDLSGLNDTGDSASNMARFAALGTGDASGWCATGRPAPDIVTATASGRQAMSMSQDVQDVQDVQDAQDAQDVQEDANAEQVFRMFDLDGDGQITAGELRSVLAKLGEDITDDEAVERIRTGDTDGDGKISLAEFLVMMGS
jgi:hypothetical protein